MSARRGPDGRFLPGNHPEAAPFPRRKPLTPEQVARMVRGNTSAKGRKGRAASSWNRGPNCDSPNARRAFQARALQREEG